LIDAYYSDLARIFIFTTSTGFLAVIAPGRLLPVPESSHSDRALSAGAYQLNSGAEGSAGIAQIEQFFAQLALLSRKFIEPLANTVGNSVAASDHSDHRSGLDP